MADEGKVEEVGKKTTYYVENTVRRVGTRLHRARSATRHRFKIFLGGQRILRNKMLPLTEEKYEQFKDRIQELILSGKVALHMPDGTKITSLPNGKLVYTRADGAVKVGEAPEAKEPLPKTGTPPSALEPDEPIPTKKKEDLPDQEKEADDLTVLPGIGASRVRKLEAVGINDFATISKASPTRLMEVIGIAEEVAAEVIAAAKEKA